MNTLNSILKNNEASVLLIVKKNEKVYYKVLKQNFLYTLLFLLNKNFEKNKLLLDNIEEANIIFEKEVFLKQNKILLSNFKSIKKYFLLDYDSKIIVTSILQQYLEEKLKSFKNFEILRIY